MPELTASHGELMPPGSVRITAIPNRTVVRLKSWLPEHTSGGKPVVLAGRELPSEVGAMLSGMLQVLCLGPGDWLFVSGELSASSIREEIESDRERQGLVLIELTDGLSSLEVAGAAARELLSKGCGLDLHPRSFPAGRCARTRFAQIPTVIACIDESARFELSVVRSYNRYLHSWLMDAAIEFDAR